MDAPAGRVAFLDGMRIAREHLEYLQDYLHLAVAQLRAAVGEGKVAHGLKAAAAGNGLLVSPGLALDAFGRPLALDEARTLPVVFADRAVLFAVLAHDLRYEAFFKGYPTVIRDFVKLELRADPPPYADGAVRFAELRPLPASPASPASAPPAAATPSAASAASGPAASAPGAPPASASPAGPPGLEAVLTPGFLVFQSGAWYLPPLAHGHSGRFYEDEAGRMRFDGQPLGLPGAMYDSGFVHIDPGGKVFLRHGLRGADFMAQLEAMGENGLITNHGSGRDYWYELPADGEAVIARTRHKEYSRFRLRLWPFGSPGAAPRGPILPVADAGEDRQAEYGASFILDGSGSRSPAGLPLRKYRWIQLS